MSARTHWAGAAAQLAALGFVAVLCIFPVESDDLFLYLKTGEVIVQNRALPETDVFSFTADEIPWVNHEWITMILFYLLHKWGGFNALIVFKTALILLCYGVLMWEARRWTRNSWLLPPLLLIIAFATSDRFIARAHIVNMLFLAAYLALLFRWRAGSRRAAWLLPAFTLIWINVHSGAILAPILMGTVMAGDAFQHLLGTRIKFLRNTELPPLAQLKRGLAPLLLHGPALVLTPFWHESVLYPVHQAGWDIYRHYVYEWMPVYSPLYLRTPVFPAFLAVCLILILAVALNARRIALADLGLAAVALVMGRSAVRFIDVLGIIAFVVTARQLAGRAWAADRHGRKLQLQVAGFLVSLLCIIYVGKHGYTITIGERKLGWGLHERVYPIIPIEYLDRLGVGGRMFNQYDMGSFLLWKCYPHRKVFIDGRNNLYPVEFYEKYLSVNSSRRQLESIMDEYGINYILILNQAKPPPHPKGIYDFLSESDVWRLIYWDDLFLVYLRNSEANRALIERHEFKHYDPVLPPEQTLARHLLQQPRACIDELERVLSLNPECYRAQVLLSNCKKVLHQQGISY